MSQSTLPNAAKTRPSFLTNWRSYVVYVGFALVFIFFSIFLRDSGFLSSNNLLNIVRQTATISVMADRKSVV